MITLRVTEASALAFIEQADYYRSLPDERLARRWEEAVDEAMRSLLHFPERGAPCRFHSPKLENLRWISVPEFSKHLVFYRFNREEQSVLVIHVMHGAWNLEAIFDAGESD